MNDYDKIISFFPNNYKALQEKARYSLIQKDWQSAIRYYNQLTQNYPPEEEFYNNQAIAFLNLKSYENALENLNKSLALNPSNCDALYNRSKLYAVMNKPDQSRKDRESIISILKNKKSKGTISRDESALLQQVSAGR